MAVFEKLDYSVRVNKSIERKLIFDLLDKVLDFSSRSKYKYIGMGSIWFVDFKIAHKKLNIDNLISIENDSIGYIRAEFNRPYDCIQVMNGNVDTALSKIHLEESPNVIWLDYESTIKKDIIEETREICERTALGSVFIVTINCNRDAFKSDKTLNVFEKLSNVVGDLLSPDITEKELDARNFPRVLSEILIAHFKRSVRKSGKKQRFYPLFNYFYKDGAPMLTVGGAITNWCHMTEIYSRIGRQTPVNEEKLDLTTINVPPLTQKEKIALDLLMPRSEPPAIEELEKIGFKLRNEQIESYYKYYKKYPIYLEAKI